MEINNNSHFSTDAYLRSQQKYNAEQSNISPLEDIKKEQNNNNNKTKAKSLSLPEESSSATKLIQTGNEINPFQAINLKRTRPSKLSGSVNNDANYKLTAHDPRIMRHAEKAVISYNRIENSQYGQELVNRIEIIV